jgi:hypothetical protein
MNREELATRLAELHRLLPTVDHVYMKGDSPDLMVRYEAKAKHETALKDDLREAEHGPVLNEDVRDSEALLRRGYSL